jgi:hypothetical protein
MGFPTWNIEYCSEAHKVLYLSRVYTEACGRRWFFSGGLIVFKDREEGIFLLKKNLFAENHFDDDGEVIFFLPRGRERFGEKQIFLWGGGDNRNFSLSNDVLFFFCSQTRLIIRSFASVCFPFHISTSNVRSASLVEKFSVPIQLDK